MLHGALPSRPSMCRPVVAALTGVCQRRCVAPIGLDASAPAGIHRSIIRIRDDHVVPHALEMLRNPFAFCRCLDENPHARATPKDMRETIARRGDALVADLTILGHNANLTFLLVQVDGTILHGWSPLLRLERVSQCGAEATTSRRGPAGSSYLWESRVVCEISKSLWEPLFGFHRDGISTAVFAVAPHVLKTGIRGMLYPCRLADRRSWRLLRRRFGSVEVSNRSWVDHRRRFGTKGPGARRR